MPVPEKVMLRIDDIGASTKQYNQYGKKKFSFHGLPYFYFPLANVWFFKRIRPFKMWGPYEELTPQEWEKLLSVFAQHHIQPIVAVTAAWVDEKSQLTPFPEKFPAEAAFLKDAWLQGKIEIANHGLTHCVVGKHLPTFWRSPYRRYRREFLSDLPTELHQEHIFRSQEILENFFGRDVTIFVPPGNIWSKKTAAALRETHIKTVMSNLFMEDALEKTPVKDLQFIPDNQGTLVLHDRDLKNGGAVWLKNYLQAKNL